MTNGEALELRGIPPTIEEMQILPALTALIEAPAFGGLPSS